MILKDIIIPLSVGLAIFFFGMEVMRIGLHSFAGKKLELWLARFTRTPLIGFITGIITTSIVQSSSAITVITVGLVNAGLITYRQSIGIILGTNIGTTVTTQLIALPMDNYALPLLVFGTLLWMLPWRAVRFSGLVLGGFAAIIIGLITIGSIAEPIASNPAFYQWFVFLGQELGLGVIVGTVLTAIIQSSTATTAISMAFVEGGLIPLASAIAIIIGSNLGTCMTAYLASIGGSLSGKKAAYAHIILNLFGVLLFLPFIKALTLLTLILANDPGTQVAHAQTIFNVISSLLVLPFANRFGQFVENIVSFVERKKAA